MKIITHSFLIIVFFLNTISIKIEAQHVLKWSDFSEISYIEKFDSTTKTVCMMPVFDNKLKSINGKTIAISGYLFPIDIQSGYYVLKADNTPLACCLSNSANPNELIELRFKEIDFKFLEKFAQKRITISGNLELNFDDDLALDLIIDAAVVLNK